MLPAIQYAARDGLTDLGWGHPAPDALPVDAWRDATVETLDAGGRDALAYGYARGPGPLIGWLCEHLRTVDLRPPEPADVFVTAGASHAVELVAQLCVRPGDVVLVDSPTYHLALRILADHGPELVAVDLADADAVGRLVRRLRTEGRRVPLVYGVPTFGNPTGRSLDDGQRAALLAVAAEAGLLIVEDDTYRELAYDGPAPSSLWSLDDGRHVVRVGSFAKTVAPGLRLGFLAGPPWLVGRLEDRGYVDSGGGVNHFAASVLATFGRSGRYAGHVEGLRRRYRRNRDALTAALSDAVPPGGGWFVWWRLPGGLRGTDLLPVAEAAGVSFLPGARFGLDGRHDEHVRLSFSMFDPDTLAAAGAVLRDVCGRTGLREAP